MIPALFITNVEIKSSARTADKSVQACRWFNDFRPEVFPATKGPEAFDYLARQGLKYISKDNQPQEYKRRNAEQGYDKKPGIAGCFASHYRAWHKCVELERIVGVFEYDAVQVSKLPSDALLFRSCLYLSAWRNWTGADASNYHNDRTSPGLHNYVGYDRWGLKDCMSGTHAYLLRPDTAAYLIRRAKEIGWAPVDRWFAASLAGIDKQTMVPAVFTVGESHNLTFDYNSGV